MNVRPLPQSIRRRLLTALVAAVCLAPVALPMLPADAAPGYKPPRRKSAQRTESTAKRNDDYRVGLSKGCPSWRKPLTVVMPQESEQNDVQTAVNRPPLLLFVGRKGATLRIQLQASNGSAPIVDYAYRTNATGLVQLPYPEQSPSLTPEQAYAWKVDIVCANDPENLQGNAAIGKFRYAEPTPELTQQLTQATTPEKQAELYASAGFWAEAFLASTTSADRTALIEQINLKPEIADAIRSSSSTNPASGTSTADLKSTHSQKPCPESSAAMSPRRSR